MGSKISLILHAWWHIGKIVLTRVWVYTEHMYSGSATKKVVVY